MNKTIVIKNPTGVNEYGENEYITTRVMGRQELKSNMIRTSDGDLLEATAIYYFYKPSDLTIDNEMKIGLQNEVSRRAKMILVTPSINGNEELVKVIV